MATRLRPPQDALNRTTSAYSEIINLYGKPRWLIPAQCKVDLSHVTARPSGVVLK